MENLGKADVKVEYSESLPNINKKNKVYNFDVTSHVWPLLQNSKNFPPLLSEYVEDPTGAFAAIFPSKRKYLIDNYIESQDADGNGTSGASEGELSVVWKATHSLTGIPVDVRSGQRFDTYDLAQSSQYTDPEYKGPKWVDAALEKEPPPSDPTTWKELFKYLGRAGINEDTPPDDGTTTTTTTGGPVPRVNYVNQTEVRDGLWWCIESSDFLKENMPFWVTIKRTRTPPTSATHETCIIIQLGLTDNDNAFDIYLSNNRKPTIVDNLGQRSGGGIEGTGIKIIPTEFDLDYSKIFSSDEDIEIGVMTIAGRLLVWVNGVPMMYTRLRRANVESEDLNRTLAGPTPLNGDNNDADADDELKLKEAKIASGKVKIFGTNIQAAINMSPMYFAPLSAFALPVPTIPPPSGGGASPIWKGVSTTGVISGSVARLPTPPEEANQIFGVDSAIFIDSNGSDTPIGFGFHRKGVIYFKEAPPIEDVTSNGSSFYIIGMAAGWADIGGNKLLSVGAPYFFRLKGAYKLEGGPQSEAIVDISKDVISVSETSTASDYFNVQTKATITLYNKGGIYDFFKDQQKGIRIEWGWNGGYKRTFTGMSLNASTSETPGNETITINCDDYMFILKNTPIVNSPFYDGMIMYYAVENLAKRGGVEQIRNDWEGDEDYFLPAGFSFSKPVMRFDKKQMLYECAINIVQRGEAFIYFDQDGVFHVGKLPGGLLSEGAGEDVGNIYEKSDCCIF